MATRLYVAAEPENLMTNRSLTKVTDDIVESVPTQYRVLSLTYGYAVQLKFCVPVALARLFVMLTVNPYHDRVTLKLAEGM